MNIRQVKNRRTNDHDRHNVKALGNLVILPFYFTNMVQRKEMKYKVRSPGSCPLTHSGYVIFLGK